MEKMREMTGKMKVELPWKPSFIVIILLYHVTVVDISFSRIFHVDFSLCIVKVVHRCLGCVLTFQAVCLSANTFFDTVCFLSSLRNSFSVVTGLTLPIAFVAFCDFSEINATVFSQMRHPDFIENHLAFCFGCIISSKRQSVAGLYA